MLLFVLLFVCLQKNPNETRILVCGPSNKSADRISDLLAKIAESENSPNKEFLRVLQIYSTPLEQIQKNGEKANALHVLAEKLSATNREELINLKSKTDELDLLQGKGPKEKGFMPKAQELVKEIMGIRKRLQALCFEAKRPNVVVTTCYGSGTQWLEGFHPTHVIIDEAGQAQVTEALFACFAISKTQAQQIILVGDRHQLAPTVLSNGVAGQIQSTCLLAF
ncbi:MAG: hypothetical protein GY861_05140, partial [bacterium]|nr:hypothetical protein [bacterium]